MHCESHDEDRHRPGRVRAAQSVSRMLSLVRENNYPPYVLLLCFSSNEMNVIDFLPPSCSFIYARRMAGKSGGTRLRLLAGGQK